MKKKGLRLLVLLVLAASMMLTMLSVSASADFTVTYRVGQTVGKTIVYGSVDGEITSATIDSGELPSGMSMSKDKTNIYLAGTPTLGGIYICTLSVNTEMGTEIVEVRVDVLDSVDSEVTPTPAPANDPPKITKNPTGETVETGGSAMFIARADNADKIVWRLVSPDTTNTVPAEDGPAYFSGLQVSGTGTETLVLSNIPKSLDGWCAECKFVNGNGTSFTTGAIITVKNKTTTPAATATPAPTASTGNVKAPVINTQPRGVNQTVGSGATLSVKAISTDGGTLSYQWYSSTEADTGNLTEISGETGSSFTPPQTEGTVYYCVSVVNTKDGKQSDPVYSNKAAVTYAQPTVPNQPLAPADSSQPDSTATPAPQTSATPRPSDNGGSGGGLSVTTSLIFFGVTGVLALAALIVIIIFLRKNAKDE